MASVCLLKMTLLLTLGQTLPGVAETVIDANGAIVTPALFAGATATGLVEVNAVRESADGSMKDTKDNTVQVGFDVRDAYSPLSSVVGVTRVEGFRLFVANGEWRSVFRRR
jgi:hypothetical protein